MRVRTEWRLRRRFGRRSKSSKAGEKVVEFLGTHLFGPDRIDALKSGLAEVEPEADHAHMEVGRLRDETGWDQEADSEAGNQP